MQGLGSGLLLENEISPARPPHTTKPHLTPRGWGARRVLLPFRQRPDRSSESREPRRAHLRVLLQRGEVGLGVRLRDVRVEPRQVAVDVGEGPERDARGPALGIRGQDLAEVLHRSVQ